MAITSLSIYQDNIIEGSNLMPVHSPLVFLVDAVYTTTTPDYIYCKVYEGETLLDTFKCVPLEDVTATQRRFMFIAHSILRGYMDDFEDFSQTNNTLVFVPNITKELTLVFSDPDEDAADVELDIVAIHGVRQTGQNPNLSEIFNNESETIYAVKDNECYVYFYNDDESNVLSVEAPTLELKFIIEDAGAPINEAIITINGETKLTNTSGEAIFNLEADTYNYSISKTGYETKTGSVILANDLTLTVDIDVVTNVTLTVITGYENDLVKIYDEQYQPLGSRTALDQGYTNASNEIDFTVESNKRYYIEVDREDKLCTSLVGGTIDDIVDVLLVDKTKTTTAGPALIDKTYNFIVRSSADNSLIENAYLTEDGTDPFGNCNSSTYLSNVNGEIAADQSKIYTIYDVIRETTSSKLVPLTFAYHITKTGFGVATGTINRTTTLTKTVYI